jgi:hypothetical protein
LYYEAEHFDWLHWLRQMSFAISVHSLILSDRSTFTSICFREIIIIRATNLFLNVLPQKLNISVFSSISKWRRKQGQGMSEKSSWKTDTLFFLSLFLLSILLLFRAKDGVRNRKSRSRSYYSVFQLTRL